MKTKKQQNHSISVSIRKMEAYHGKNSSKLKVVF